MLQLASLISIATAIPPYCFEQRDVAMAAHQHFAQRIGDFERLARVFESPGVVRRYGVRPLEWYLQPLGWPERSAAYVDGACKMLIEAAQKALDAAGCLASDVDTVVTVSSTGIATPSLDARVAAHMGFRTDIERVPVFGLGCAGGVAGLSLAARLAQSRPGSLVLMVAVEACSLSFRMEKLTKENIVATSLFADGAAALVLCVTSGGIAQIEMSGQHTWPDTLDVMGWSVDREGFGVIFDRDIPSFAEREMLSAVTGMLIKGKLGIDDFDRLAFHPGGTKVLTALERAFSLAEGALLEERTVLADYGNMSAPTALFVLDRLVQAGLPPRTLLTAMGPGFTTSCVSLRRTA